MRYLTSGESHGQALLGILDGVPSGLSISEEAINTNLARRQSGYGRGDRMKIEKDEVEIISGIRRGVSLGSPIGMIIRNRDWASWQEVMAVKGEVREGRVVTRPRPGHADLPGAIKYSHTDIRNVLERASARDTAMRVAVGSIAKILLGEFGIDAISHVVEIGGVRARYKDIMPATLFKRAERSELRCADQAAGNQMIKAIDSARERGDTVGGIFEIIVANPPVGLGSYSQWDRRLGARLAMSLMSIQAIKGIEIGIGFEAARLPGSKVHDEIYYRKSKVQGLKINGGFYRRTNNAGGIEGGITNGDDIVIRAAMKPIATLYKPLKSVDIATKRPFEASIERSDVCAVPAASVIGEAVVAFEVANAMIEKFGGDSIKEMKRNYKAYMEYVKGF